MGIQPDPQIMRNGSKNRSVRPEEWRRWHWLSWGAERRCMWLTHVVCIHHIKLLWNSSLSCFKLICLVCVFATVSLSPRMELPPLSPGIHDSVIDVVVVFVTVRRGWSGGTKDKTKVHCMVSLCFKLPHVSLLRFSVKPVISKMGIPVRTKVRTNWNIIEIPV